MRVLLFFICILISALSFQAQDLVFQKNRWQPNGPVYAMEVDSVNNLLYIGGSFSHIGPMNNSYGVIVDKNTNELIDKQNQFTSDVYASVKDGNGGWFVAGHFFYVFNDNDAPSYLVHVLADGEIEAWSTGVDGPVYTMVRQDSILYIAGKFRSVDGQARNNIAAININTGKPTSWNPGVNARVNSILVYDSTIYLGGEFTNVNGEDRKYLASVHAETGKLNSWKPEINRLVNTMVITDSSLFVGGFFTEVNSSRRRKVASFNLYTGQLTNWSIYVGGSVYKLAVKDSLLYAAGSFSTVGLTGKLRWHIAAINLRTRLATDWNPSISGDGFHVRVLDMHIEDSILYIGGNFDYVGEKERTNAAAINLNTGIATNWNPNPADLVHTITPSINTVFIGGEFYSIGGKSRNSLAAIDLTTGIPNSWKPELNGFVLAMELNDTTLYVGGGISTSGLKRQNLAAFSTKSAVLTEWNPAPDDVVKSIQLIDSTVYIGGRFDTINGQKRNYLAAVNKDDGAVTSWNPAPDERIETIYATDSLIYVGGFFKHIGGLARSHFAAINKNTGSVASIAPNPDGPVYTIDASKDEIYFGGRFTRINGLYRNNLASVEKSSGRLTSWDPDADAEVYSLEVKDSLVYIAGEFNYLDLTSNIEMVAQLNRKDGKATSLMKFRNSLPLTIISDIGYARAITSHKSDIIYGGQVQTREYPYQRHLLTLNSCKESSSRNSVSACNSYTWIDGNTYYRSRQLEMTFENACGQDSLVTLFLYIDSINTSVRRRVFDFFEAEEMGASYQWLDCNNGYAVIPGATSRRFHFEEGRSYAVEVARGPCKDTSDCYTTAVGLNEQPFQDQFLVYPNPSTEIFNIQLSENISDKLSYKLINPIGQTIPFELTKKADLITIKIEDEAGLYLLELTDNLGRKVFVKLLKE